MEKKMFIALALSMVVLIAWPMMFNKKDSKSAVTSSISENKGVDEGKAKEKAPADPVKQAKLGTIKGGETHFIENSFIRVVINSKGAVISQIIFKDYKDDKKEFIKFFGDDVEKNGAFYIKGLETSSFRAKMSGPTTIELFDGAGNIVSYSLGQDSYRIGLTVKRASGKDDGQFRIYSRTLDTEDGNYGLSKDPDKRNKELLMYSAVQEKTTRTNMSKVLDKGAIYFNESFRWLALSDRYFMMAFLDTNNSISEVSSNCMSNGDCTIDLSVRSVKGSGSDLSLFAGPKDVTYMRQMDPSMTEAIDYGWLSFISVPMLELMRFFYGAIPNYGVAILILTLLVRLLMFPLQHKAMKSMKRMQDLQPHLKGIQEKYKNDKETLNKEMLQFMKTHKVNPMSGCLPILIQLPVFIALYKVLANSVELYRSPFIFWITDLSVKDHYYILPLLMGIMMFVQQKMTPNPTMDPTQAKIMLYMMPVIFTLLMINLPSGLTLYIMFSTLLGIVQQLATNRILSAKK